MLNIIHNDNYIWNKDNKATLKKHIPGGEGSFIFLLVSIFPRIQTKSVGRGKMAQLRNGSPACTEPCFITQDKKSKKGHGGGANDCAFAPKI